MDLLGSTDASLSGRRARERGSLSEDRAIETGGLT
jgi:hypothetical protein